MSKLIMIATASVAAAPLIHSLAGKGHRVLVCIPQEYELLKQTFLQAGGNSGIDFMMGTHKIIENQEPADWFITMGFPHKIDLKKLPAQKAVNIHFGPLPECRGPDPLFHTLREGKTLAYITIHELTNRFDAGPILLQKGFSIYPGENYGLLAARLGSLTPPLIQQLFEQYPEPLPQNEDQAHTYSRPARKDYTLNWQQMPALEIENTVNAANPKYNGAIARFLGSGAELRILEVSPAEINLAESGGKQEPGTVVLADHQGLFVLCKENRFLRLNVVSTTEAILSGQKLAALGIHAGIRFE